MISEKEVLEIHAILIERFGGSDGVRDKELLDSVVYSTLYRNKQKSQENSEE